MAFVQSCGTYTAMWLSLLFHWSSWRHTPVISWTRHVHDTFREPTHCSTSLKYPSITFILHFPHQPVVTPCGLPTDAWPALLVYTTHGFVSKPRPLPLPSVIISSDIFRPSIRLLIGYLHTELYLQSLYPPWTLGTSSFYWQFILNFVNYPS